MVKNATNETKLIVLHWKIVHNIYVTGILLEKMKKRRNNKCMYCGEVETIEHFFYECRELRKLWNEVKVIIDIISNGKIKISEKEAILGIIDKTGLNEELINKINIIIILAKKSIGQVKYGDKYHYILNFENLLRIRKIEYRVEY